MKYVVMRPDLFNSEQDRYIQCAIEAPAIEDRGYVVLVVDETIASQITTELNQLKEDLVGDGWRVIRHDVPRHDDSVWSSNPGKIASVKSLIDNDYTVYGAGLKSIFIIGHVPIPHAGSSRPDGHQTRPFQVDLYYGDTVRSANDWTDSIDFTTQEIGNPIWPFNPPVHNGPGDYYFDQLKFPSKIEVHVGRVDFAGLPVFTSNPPPGVSPISEVNLIKRYLTKDHRYRHKQLVFGGKVALHNVPIPFPGYSGDQAICQALRNGQPLFGGGPALFKYVHIFRGTGTESFLWGFQFGGGYYDAIANTDSSQIWTSADLADPAKEKFIGFYMLDGSFLGDWNNDDCASADPNKACATQDNFLRSLLALENSGMASMWGRQDWSDVSLQPTSLGDPIGEARIYYLNSLDGRDPEFFVLNVIYSLLGDPTSRLQIEAPPQNVNSQIVGADIALSWTRSTDTTVKYHVYRSLNGLDGPFTRLTVNPVGENSFTDQSAPSGTKLYQVRAVRLTTTGSGSFYNLSQGVFVTAN